MRMARYVFGLGLTAGVACLPAIAQTAAPKIEDVLAAATVNFNNTGTMDRAVLAQGADGADLYLFLGDDSAGAPPKMTLALVKKSFVWTGAMWGALPSLEVNDKGSLVVKSENTAIGRDRWQQAATVVRRGGEFVVIGLTYSANDTLDPKAGGSCDLNLATGKGVRNGKPVTFPAKPVKVADWDAYNLPKECQF